MKVSKENNKIVVQNENDFNISQILECGQVFSFQKVAQNCFCVVSAQKFATIFFDQHTTTIECDDVDYFFNYFDLNTNYKKIKQDLQHTCPNFAKFFLGGEGIRILRQDVFQTIISFIVSANNNISRIKKILFAIMRKCSQQKDDSVLPPFPTREQLSKLSKQDFDELGCGYRSNYLVQTIKQLGQQDFDVEGLKTLSTPNLKAKLVSLAGVGPKVADCILLFGFGRTDVFPVDTWTNKAYSLFSSIPRSKTQIAKFFVDLFGANSGYAQQYIYNYMLSSAQKI